jgi:sugar phosphate isomerase/epimerase
VVNVAADVPGSLYDPDEQARKGAIEAREKWINVAAALGSPSVRLNNPPARGAKPDAALMAASLRTLGVHGARQRVIVNLENDNLVSEDALFLAEVIDQVHSPWVHALPDFCNSMLSGNEDFEYKALTELFKRAANICHVKEYEIGEGDRVYRIDVARAFGILNRSGYRGFCSMEWEGKGDPYEGTRELLAKSLKYLS